MDVSISKVFSTFRGKRSIVIDNFKLRESNILQNGCIRFRCTVRKCGYTVLTDESCKRVLIESAVMHTDHKKYSDEDIAKQEFKVSLKRKATESVSEKPSKMIRKAVQNSEELCAFNNKELPGLRKMINKARKKRLPAPIPKSHKEAVEQLYNLQEKITVRVKNGVKEQFCFVNDEKNMIIFTCAANLTLLQESDDVFGDGTFSYAPKFFLQLYTIHVCKNGFYVPVAFSFLCKKDAQTYVLMWTELQKLSVRLTGKTFKITFFYADFEKACHNAVKIAFIDVVLFCCGFHLGQSWFRHIQSNKVLLREYNDVTSKIGKWLKYFFGLSFLPPCEVLSGYEDLMSIKPEGAPTDFSDYVLDNYILFAQFPPELWARVPSAQPRTTNGPESYHSNYNAEFYHPHPSIHDVTQVLTEIQVESFTKILSISLNQQNKPRQAVASRLETGEKLWRDYEAGPRTRERRLQYIKEMGYLNQAKKI